LKSRYIEFSFTTSQTFTVTKIVAPIYSAGSSTGTGSYFYSTDGVNYTLLISGKSQAKIVTILKSDFTLNSIDVPNVVLTAGQTFYFRYLPTQNTTKTSTGKGLGFERITILGSQGNLAPVTFSNINASINNKESLINWSAKNEINTVNYSIEKSSNGSEFKEIGIVAASKRLNYSYTDLTPTSGVNYYRIKAIDNNGAVLYSSVVKVLNQTLSGITVFPNPVIGRKLNIQIDGVTIGHYTLNIYSINGQKVSSTTLTLSSSSLSQTLALPNSIKAGTYQLELSNGFNRITKTISVQ